MGRNGSAMELIVTSDRHFLPRRETRFTPIEPPAHTLRLMAPLRARVTEGRLVLNEPTDLPEGTVFDLVVDDEGDDLDNEDRARLDAAIERAWNQIKSGQSVPAEDVLSNLRNRR